MSAAEPSRPFDLAPPGRVRALVTPEGVDLKLVLGSAGQRALAFLIDAAILLGVLVALSVLCLVAGLGFRAASAQAAMIVWTLGFFALRNGYFLLFELGARGATPGKRAMGLRVAARDGGRLRADAVFARNAMREVELFLPLGFLLAGGANDPLAGLAGLLWSGGLLLLPLLNADRLRAGDLVAGTWVVRDPRRTLRRDMAGGAEALPAGRFAFTPGQLDAYGELELHVLEEVLRRVDRATVADVAGRIRSRIAWTAGPDERDLDFLDAFYAAQRRKLERDLLFGRRKRDARDGA